MESNNLFLIATRLVELSRVLVPLGRLPHHALRLNLPKIEKAQDSQTLLVKMRSSDDRIISVFPLTKSHTTSASDVTFVEILCRGTRGRLDDGQKDCEIFVA